MPQQLLGYPCLKTVLKHLDANSRSTLADRCFELRNLHKILPLHISHLTLDQSSFTINNVVHSFRAMVNNSTDGNILPEDLEQMNMEGGAPFDHDEYGRKHLGEERLPTDIRIPFDFEQYADDHLEQIREDLYQMRFLTLIRLKNLMSVTEEQARNGSLSQRHFRIMSVNLLEDIDDLVGEMTANGERTVISKHTSYVVHTTTALPNTVPLAKSTVEVFETGSKIHKAYRNELTRLMKNRKVLIVNRLTIVPYKGILAIPDGFKVKVNTLSVRFNSEEVLNSFRRIIDDSSFPLKQLKLLSDTVADPVFRTEIFRSAKTVMITTRNMVDAWAEVLVNSPNPKMFLITDDEIPFQFITGIINRSKTFPKDDGSMIAVQCHNVGAIFDRLKDYNDFEDGGLTEIRCLEFSYSFSVGLGGTKELKIYGDKVPDTIPEDGKPWMIVFEYKMVL